MSPPSQLPLCTLAVLAFALVVDSSPLLSSHLALERAAVQDGELWRLLSGHLVHEVPRVAVVDLTVLVILGSWIELRSRALLGAVLAASALLSSLALLLFTEFPRCVGSSGLGSGLLAAAIVLVFRGGKKTLALVVAALFGFKLALELLGLWPAALGTLPPGYETASAVHLGGALGGAWVGIALGRPEKSLTSESPY